MFLSDASNVYYYDADIQDLKHFPTDYQYIEKPVYFNGKFIGTWHDGMCTEIEFWEFGFTDQEWKLSTNIDMSKLPIDENNKRYGQTQHFVHNSKLWIALPPKPSLAEDVCLYREVDLIQSDFGTLELELCFHDMNPDFLSLPSWILL